MKSRNLSRIVVTMFVTLIVPAITTAQEGPPSQFEHVKGLEPFIGFWAGEAPEGDEGNLAVVCRWAANRSYGQFNIWTQVGEERTHLGTIQIGWDGAEQKLALWSFFPDGQAEATPSIEGGTLKWSSQGTSASGVKTSAEVTFDVDGDTLTIEVRNARRGDADEPDMNISLTRRQRD